jgi:electron transfer flavoprotein alpha subunit
VVTAAGTSRGNEVLAHVAVRLGVTMAANVVAVDSTDPLVVSRQVLGGAAMEEMPLADQVAVLTVAGHACEAQPAAARRPRRWCLSTSQSQRMTCAPA